MRCIIIDDEPLARDVLKTYISRLSSLELIRTFDNAIDALQAVERDNIELIFCDVQMPELTGVEFIKSLKQQPFVILTTAFAEYAIDGFDVDAVDFLLKPIAFERFLKAVNKVNSLLKNDSTATKSENDNFLFVKEDYKIVKIDLSDIFFVEGMKDYVKILTTHARPVITHITMKRLEELLPTDKFLRVHKSFIIRFGAIKSIYGNVIETLNGAQVPIGLQYKDLVMSKLHNIN